MRLSPECNALDWKPLWPRLGFAGSFKKAIAPADLGCLRLSRVLGSLTPKVEHGHIVAREESLQYCHKRMEASGRADLCQEHRKTPAMTRINACQAYLCSSWSGTTSRPPSFLSHHSLAAGQAVCLGFAGSSVAVLLAPTALDIMVRADICTRAYALCRHGSCRPASPANVVFRCSGLECRMYEPAMVVRDNGSRAQCASHVVVYRLGASQASQRFCDAQANTAAAARALDGSHHRLMTR